MPKPRPANVFKLAEAVGVQLPGAPAQLYLDIMAGEFQWGEFAKSPENEIEEVKQKRFELVVLGVVGLVRMAAGAFQAIL